MANQFIKVDSVSRLGVKHAYVPDPNDEVYRNTQRNAWAFRLSAEFKAMKDQGWSVGFFTLTYNDQHLPVVPRCLWKDESKFERLCAFSRSDVRDFLDKLRRHLRKVYRIEHLQFMICSELGPNTRRSHYHGVICWPEHGHTYHTERVFKGSVIDKTWTSLPCSDKDLHDAIRRIWEIEGKKGYVRPWHYLGGVDSHGHKHSPFKVDGDHRFCCKYAGKYCVKDLYYYEYLNDYSEFLDTDSSYFKRLCAPFHMQSRSLGASILGEFSTDSEKMNLLLNGYQFIGSDKFLRIPVYIRNKLVFDNVYQFDDNGNRLVRRQANKFFRDNAEEIFDHKAEFYAQTFKNLLSSGYLEGRGVDADNAEYVSYAVSRFLDQYNLSVDDFARCYLAWYGVEKSYCFDVPPYNQWFGRYVLDEHIHFDGCKRVDAVFLDDLEFVVNCCMFGLGLIPAESINKLSDKIKDFASSEVG